MENEIMTNIDEMNEISEVVLTDSGSGINAGSAVLIGTGCACAVVALYELGKFAWKKFVAAKKAKGEPIAVFSREVE